MAALAGVSDYDVTLKVTSASVLLSYTIAAASSDDADAFASTLSSQLSSTSAATSLLGLDAYGFEALSIPTISTSSSSSDDDDEGGGGQSCGPGCAAGVAIGALLGGVGLLAFAFAFVQLRQPSKRSKLLGIERTSSGLLTHQEHSEKKASVKEVASRPSGSLYSSEI